MTSLLNNYVFQLKGTLTTGGTTVAISNDIETDQTVVFTDAYIVMRNRNGSKIERMKGTAAGGTLTLSLRGLPQDTSETPDPTLYKEWTDGTTCYVTMLAQNLVDADSNNTFSGDQTFDGDNTFNGTNEFNDATTFNADVTVTGATTGIDTSGAKAGFILPNLTTVQRLALPLTNGTHVYDTDLGEEYQVIAGARQPVAAGSTQPNASTTVAGKGQVGTVTAIDELEDIGSTGAINWIPPSYIPANEKATLSDDDQFTIYDSEDTNFRKTVKAETFNTYLTPVMGYGDGSDGDVVISSNTTLTRDMFYNNLTINSGSTLSPAGYKIFVKGTLLNSGTISRSGNVGGNASGQTGGSAATSLNQGTLNDIIAAGAGGNGGNGSNGGNGTAGSDSNPSYNDANGSTGGAGGGAGNTPGTGGAGGTATRGSLYNVIYSSGQIVAQLTNPASFANAFPSSTYKGLPGSGGGGGGSSATYIAGGGGGGGGTAGVIRIAANIFNNQGTISCIGGNGGNGASGVNGTSGGGGGGAGGGGGIVYLIFESYTNGGTINVSGGTGGNGGNGVSGGGIANGGSGGNGGNGGLILLSKPATVGTTVLTGGSGGTGGLGAGGGSTGGTGTGGSIGQVIQVS